MSNKIRLRIHHRGKLVETPVKWYVNGEVTEMNWSWDVDYMSYMDVEDMIKSEGYVNIKCLWYWHPAYSFSRGLRPLNNDQDVLQFSKDVVGYYVIDVYVEHNVGIPQIIDDSELVVELAFELDAKDEVQCIGFKTTDVTEDVTIVEEVSTEDENIDLNGVAEDDITIDPNEENIDLNGVVEDDIITDPNGVNEEGNSDPNGVAKDGVTTDPPGGAAEEENIDPNVAAEEGSTDIDEDYVASEGSFEDSEYQFNEESEESEMD
ncbi:unnamed protein product [Lathyrus oleraceus]